jgi:hypothetical protein
MEITVNRQKFKLDKAIKLSELPGLIGVLYPDEDKRSFSLSDNNTLLSGIPDDDMTQDGHEYIVFQITAGG